MIVDPDFVDHWKTRTLVALLGDDEAAPVYVIRLWAHCQNRKTWVFDLPTPALKAICRYTGDADKFESAMRECGFVSREGIAVTVVGWDQYNASLIAAWANGNKGGRPRKAHIEDSKKTHGLPTGNPADNPAETHGLTDKRRVEKIREETSKADARATRLPADWMPNESDVSFCRKERPDLMPQEVADQFRDYWIAQPGTKGKKTDWQATWRNWVRNQRAANSPTHIRSYHDERADTIAALTGRKRANYEHDDRTVDVPAFQLAS